MNLSLLSIRQQNFENLMRSQEDNRKICIAADILDIGCNIAADVKDIGCKVADDVKDISCKFAADVMDIGCNLQPIFLISTAMSDPCKPAKSVTYTSEKQCGRVFES